MGDLAEMSGGEFARRVGAAVREQDKRYAFFLGAGCSISSDIPAAGTLVRDHWLPRLKRFCAPDSADDAWITEKIAGYEATNPAGSYGAVMEALFINAEERQREIERLCDGRFPAFGYAVLAQLMALDGGAFNVALTTNFDDLPADALYLFTPARPLVIQHESLAAFIRPTRTRPLIVKLHGDNRLTPMNTSQETARLSKQLENEVLGLLNDRGLIVMGYGGNDEGIARLFESLPARALPLGIYWVSGSEPSGAIRSWLEERSAIWVRERDFDETMLLLRDAVGLKHPDDRRFDDVFTRYWKAYEELSSRIDKGTDDANDRDTNALQTAVRRADASGPDWLQAFSAAARAQRRGDRRKAAELYERGIDEFPDNPMLLGSFAAFLHEDRTARDRAEAMYERALVADPKDAINLGNYANFLAEVRKDPDRAQAMYERALAADPNHANNLGNYAVFLAGAGKDVDRAEATYKRALTSDPNHANNLSNYASFLDTVRKDFDRAEAMYERALAADPDYPNALGNYANFLNTVRKDADRAEAMYERALAADTNNASNLGRYAVFLKKVRKDFDRAEAMYERALAAGPDNANNLGNYAIFLAEVRKDADRAEAMYERALAADPNHANNLGRYANFLKNVRKDFDRAEAMYERALAADPNNTYNIGSYANFLYTIRKDAKRAEATYERALAADPDNANNLASYANFLYTIRKDAKRAEATYERALAADPDNAGVLGGYAYLLHDSNEDADRAEAMYERALAADPDNAYNIGGYALFLKNVRHDSDRAGAMYERAAAADPDNAVNLGNYANFIYAIRKDSAQAAAMYERAIIADPDNANNLGNYAGLLFAKGQRSRAQELAQRALSHAELPGHESLLAEVRFYQWANGSEEDRTKRLSQLKALIERGARSEGWDFSANIERAASGSRSDIDWMRKLADVIADKQQAEVLDDWPAWQEAAAPEE